MSSTASRLRRFTQLAAAVIGFAAASVAAAAPTQIYALGDSITYGYSTVNVSSPGGYREPLLAHLKNAGRDVQYVGVNTGNPGLVHAKDGQEHHDGYPKYTITNVADNLDASVATGTNTPNNGGFWLTGTGARGPINPDIVLLLIGTNDVEGGANAREIADRLDLLVDKLYDLRPNIHLYLASIPPHLNDAVKTATSAAYNDLIETEIVPRYQDQNHSVTFVDQYPNYLLPTGAVDPSMFGDRLHPNAVAYQKMGDTWAAALVPEPALLTPVVLAAAALHRRRRTPAQQAT